jgi:RNA recognition motif-containing protein
MPATPEDVLERIFNLAAGRERAVERVKKIRDFAFVHFHERDDAVRALSVMHSE